MTQSNYTTTGESCHTHEWVMSHILMRHEMPENESCHIRMCVSHICVTYTTPNVGKCSYHELMNESCRMSHVTHMKESCHPNEWVMSRMWRSHVSRMNDLYQICTCESHIYVTYTAKMSASVTVTNIWMSHVTHMDKSCHTYGWVMSHMWMSHVKHVKESCHTYERSLSISSCEKHICVTCTASKCRRVSQSRTYEWDMPHTWMNHVTQVKERHVTYMNDLYHIRTFETHICVMYTTRKCRRV